MNCPCGGTTKETEHQVKTLKIAQDWFKDVTLAELPITVEQRVCVGCGRSQFAVWDRNKTFLYRRG